MVFSHQFIYFTYRLSKRFCESIYGRYFKGRGYFLTTKKPHKKGVFLNENFCEKFLV
ncbi:hypothetical protein CHCC15075_3682 [Bacillus licheniformis]|nr:hypothetical protein B4090_0521 [Bacillus licheniformis]OLF94414.1 hypothetical protein B4094_1776 [Bacillus licheniformis]TWK25887.1 hypothetical protein CHCC20369_2120 [Bacillus licheniformis]TWL69886.1 hypothetical protein CHCC15315_2973 [Bacillus licheniformis]TWM21998.1 hypothetical protein CHCC15075_3682 [Bacillus licheniformis]